MKKFTKLLVSGILLISNLSSYAISAVADADYAFTETYEDYVVSEHNWTAGSAGVKPEIVTDSGNKYLKYTSNGKTHGAYEKIDEIDCTDAKIEIEADLKFAPTGTAGNSQFTIGSSLPKFDSNNIDYGYTTTDPVSDGHIIAFEYKEGKTFTVNKTEVSTDFIGEWMHMKATVDFGAKNIDITLTNDNGSSAELNGLNFYSTNEINSIGSYYVRAAKSNGTVSIDNLTITNNLWRDEDMPVAISLSDNNSVALDALTAGHSCTVSSIFAQYADGSSVETTDFSISVSDTKIASVSDKTITANQAGAVTVKFSFMGRTVEKLLEIKSFIPEIKLDKIAFMTNTGEETKINVTADENTDLITFSSDNDKVATVDSNGNVTAVGKGDAVITITAVNNETNDTCEKTCIVSVDYNGQNPIIPPTWGLYMADGEVYEFDGVAYMYGSRDLPNGYDADGKQAWCSQDYHILYSTDLINWTDVGVVLTIDDIPGYSSDSGYRLWAPDMFKAPNGKYYLLSCTEWNIRKFYISESDSPTGPFTNTKRIEVAGSGSGITSIDPGVLVDDDGTVYMATANLNETKQDIYILNSEKGYAEATSKMTITLPDSFSKNFKYVEGPSLRKRGDTYYYIFIATPATKNANVYMQYLYTKNIKDPTSWQYGGTIVTSNGFLNEANIHGSIFDFQGEWYVSYHRPAPGFSNYTRCEALDKVNFNEDGTIVEVKRTSSGVKGAFKIGEKIQAASAVEFSGGKGDNRFTLRDGQYAYAYFDKAKQYIGYRYVDMRDGADSVTVNVKTTGSGSKLAVKNAPDGQIMTEISLPDTNGEWQDVTADINNKLTGTQEVYLELTSAPTSGNVALDWFTFNSDDVEDAGYKINGEVTDGKLNATIIDTVNDKDITAYIAEYDSNGTLVKVISENAKGGKVIENYPLTNSTDTVKVFLWEDMCPATDTVFESAVNPEATPTASPSAAPTEIPTASPSAAPTETPTPSPSAAPTETPTASPSAAPTETSTPSPDATPEATTDPGETYTTDVIIKFVDEEGNQIKEDITVASGYKFHSGDTYTVPEEYQTNILIKNDDGYYYYIFNEGTSTVTAYLEPETTILTLTFNGDRYDYYETFEDYTINQGAWNLGKDSSYPTIADDNNAYLSYASTGATAGAWTTFNEIDTTGKMVKIEFDLKFAPTGTAGNSQFSIGNTSPSFDSNNISYGIIGSSGTAAGHIIGLAYNEGKAFLVNGQSVDIGFIGDWMHIDAEADFVSKKATITISNANGKTAEIRDVNFYSSCTNNIGSMYVRAAKPNGTVSVDNLAIAITGDGIAATPDEESVLNFKTVYAFGDSIVQGHNAPNNAFMNLIANKYSMYLTKYSVNGATVIKSSNDIITQINKASSTEPDFVVFDGYTNDAYDTVIGKEGEIQGSGANSFDNTTFCGAFEEILYTMKKKWPNAKIVFVTIHESNARDRDLQIKLRELSMEMCDEWGVEVVDMFTYENEKGERLNTYGQTDKSAYMNKYIINGSGSHPTVAACEEFYIPAVVEVMESLCDGEAKKVTVTATVNGNGSVTIDGQSQSSIEVSGGSYVTLKAIADSGYKFVNWTADGAEVSASAEYTPKVFEDLTVIANFEALADGEKIWDFSNLTDEKKIITDTNTAEVVYDDLEIHLGTGGDSISENGISWLHPGTTTADTAAVSNNRYIKYTPSTDGILSVTFHSSHTASKANNNPRMYIISGSDNSCMNKNGSDSGSKATTTGADIDATVTMNATAGTTYYIWSFCYNAANAPFDITRITFTPDN